VWGELTTIAAQNKGIVGLVVDGAVRDADIIRSARFPVMVRHIVPTAGKTRLRLGSVNEEPVLCGGVAVNPGDFIFADESGVVVCPQSMTESVIIEVQKIQTRETEMKKNLARGLSYIEAARELGLRQL
jgi:3-hexulose-6-phosphate synthase/6-phospho-3-hexuloisomerase